MIKNYSMHIDTVTYVYTWLKKSVYSDPLWYKILKQTTKHKQAETKNKKQPKKQNKQNPPRTEASDCGGSWCSTSLTISKSIAL